MPPVFLAELITCLLMWDAPQGGPKVDGFRLHWGSKPGVYNEQMDVGNKTTHAITVDSKNRPYVVVRAYNADGESDPSNEVQACDSNGPVLTSCPQDRQAEIDALKDALARQTVKTASYVNELRKQEAKTASYAAFGFKYRTEAEGARAELAKCRAGK